MRIVIETQPTAAMRYPTLGDYWVEDGVLQVRVSALADARMSFLVAIHELVEFHICKERGITEPEITAFDLAVPDDSPYAADPGHDPSAPYHEEHVFAEAVERLVAQQLGVNWQAYEAACEAEFPE